MDPDTRRWLADLYREDDRMQAETEAFLARRRFERAAQMRETDDGPENAPAASPEAVVAPSSEDGGGFVLNLFDDPLLDRTFTDFMLRVCAGLRDEWQEHGVAEFVERDRRIGILEGELRELKGMLGGLLTVMGGAVGATEMMAPTHHDGGGDVVELPRGFLRKVHHG